MTTEKLTTLSPEVIEPVYDAFEIFVDPENPRSEPVHEHLITLTRGRLLQAGDEIPAIPGVEVDGPYLLHVVNELGTPTCEDCVDEIDSLQHSFPDLPIFTLTKQSAEAIQKLDKERAAAGKPATHARLTVGQETAIDLGVAIEPGQDASTEFWPNALRRSLILVGADHRIIYIDQPSDQEVHPGLDPVYEAAANLGL